MSSTLYWRPIVKGEDLPDELKDKIDKEFQLPRIFCQADTPYLRGLRDCDIHGADKLIALIDQYDEVELRLEY